VVVAFLGTFVAPRLVRAQANVPGMRGDWGLKSGTQMTPGAYLGGIYYNYSPDKVVDRNGVSLPRIDVTQQAAGLFPAYVSPKPIFGGHWGAFAAIAWANAAITVANVEATTGWGFSDVYVQPVYLGWTFSRADVTTGFGITAPTGRFHDGATDNTGLGMWSYAFDAGATVYADSAKRWSLATLATFQTNSDVRSTDHRAGNIISLEGGAGYGVMKDMGVVGIAYYTQWKVSDDRNFPILQIPRFNARSQYYAVGPEATLPLTVKPLPLILTARYFFEMGNRVATQGNSLFVMLTLAKPYIPKLPKPPC
jgi:hypothetical protein